MRIVYMLTSLGIGGAEKQVVLLAERMHARGHVVRILVLMEPADQEWRTNIVVDHLGVRKSPAYVIAGAYHAVRILGAFRPDVLHCHTLHANLFGRLLKIALPWLRVISTIHNTYEGDWRRMLAYRVTDRLCLRTFAVCQAAAHEAVRRRAVPALNCPVIHNGFDADEYMPESARRVRFREEMAADDFVWVTVGRIVPAKDYGGLLRAFARVHQDTTPVELWIVGEGRADYGNRMRALSIELGLEKVVRWLGLRDDLAALLDAADGFVLGSAWEGMPLAIGEAMAMEKPCVVTDVGGAKEILGTCGTLVRTGDPDALAAAMLGVMAESADARLHTGRAARRRIQERFSMDAKATEWEAVYESFVVQRT